MSRLHVHVGVADLEASIPFYRTLFGAEPIMVKPDYAKWSLTDPAVNFAISARAAAIGVDHLGIEVDDGEGLAAIAARLKAAGETTADQSAASCCYAKSDKTLVRDPSGLSWETFHTFGEATTYGEDAAPPAAAPTAACCAPA